MPRSKRLVLPLFLVLAGACALAGCGRRGPLELPPGVTVPPPPEAANTDPHSQSNSTRPSLARDTTSTDPLAREQALAPTGPIIVPRTPFFLDPLL